jgi:hypothetical protein
MNLRDVLTRLRLKRTSFTDNSSPLANEAVRLARPLGQPISTRTKVCGFNPVPRTEPSGSTGERHWENSVSSCAISPGAAMRLHRNKQILIRVDTGQWHVQRKAAGGWETIAGDWGTRSLRACLANDSPPRHPLFVKR